MCRSCRGNVFVALDGIDELVSSSAPPGTPTEGPPLKVLLAAVLEELHDGVIACDQEGEIVLFNRAARELFSVPSDTLVPEAWGDHYDVFHGDGRTPIQAGKGPLTWALEGGIVRNTEVVVVPKDGGSPRPLLISGRAISRHGGRLGAVIVMHEISSRKQEEEARLEAVERRARQRQALEVNDNVVQSLVAASWALRAGDVDRGGELLESALDASVKIVRGDLEELKKGRPAKPGDFVRERAAGETGEDG